MGTTFWGVCAGTAACVVLLLAGHALGIRALIISAKTCASLGFLCASFVAGAPATGYGRAVLTAQSFAFVGDVLLLGRTRASFVAGLGAFVSAHLTLAAAFLHRGVAPAGLTGALVVLTGVGALALRWLSPHVSGGMRVAVGIYVAVISLMVAFASGTALSGAAGPSRGARPWLVVVAAFAFYVSDLCVARERFVRKGLRNRLVGLPLYYTAQLLFAASLADGLEF